MAEPHNTTSDYRFLAGGGETGALIAAFDWSATTLGPVATWPQCLRTATGILLHSPVPMVMLWGEDGVMLYNDAYSVFAGGRHPGLLGAEVRKGWPEVAEFNDNVMKVVLGGGTLTYRDQELTLFRNERPEQVWMNLDYSPVLDESGRPAGVLAIVVETTERVLAERRTQTERQRLERMFEQAPGMIAMVAGPDHVFELANPAYLRLIGGRDVIGKPVRHVLPELEEQGLIGLLDEVFQSGRAHVGVAAPVTLTPAPGRSPETRFLDFVYQPLLDAEGKVTGIFAEGQDVTERALAGERARASEAGLQRRSTQLQALAETAIAVARAPNLQMTLEEITQAARRIIGAHQGVVSMSRGHDWSQAITAVSLTDTYARRRDYAAPTDGSGIYSWLCEQNRSVRMTQAELEAHPRWRGFGAETSAHPPMRGWLAAPLIGRDGRNLGLIQLSDKLDDAEFDEADEAMLVQLAQLASTAIEQTEAETALLGSNERFRAAVDAVEGVLWTNSAAGEMEGEQPGWAALTGQSFEEYRGFGWTKAVHPDDIAPTVEAWRATVAKGEAVAFEHRVRRHDGAWRRFSVRAIPVRKADGSVHEWVGVHTDVTERRAAEAALRRSEAQLRLGLAAGRMVAWDIDLATGIVTRSENAEEIFGPGSLPEDFQSRLPEEDRLANQARIEDAIAGNTERYESEFRYRHPDGRLLWLQNQGHVVRDPAGEARRIHGICLDVTARKIGELALRASEERLRAAVLASPFPIMLHAEDGEVLELSRKWTEITGYRREEIATHFDWFRLAYPEADPAELSAIITDEFGREGEIRAGEMAVRVRDGTSRIWDFYNVALGRLPDGRKVQISAAADVTERKRAQDALLRLNEGLENEAAERTAERDRIWRLSRDLFAIFSRDGVLRRANPAWTEILGFEPFEVEGKHHADLQHPEDRKQGNEALVRLARGGTVSDLEDRYRHKDGTYRRIAWTAAAPEGDLIFAVGRDVTEERETRAALELAEAARRDADAIYRAYFRNSGEALFVVAVQPDGGFSIEELNPAHEAATGLRTAEIRGKRLEEQLPPDAAVEVAERFRRAVSGGEVLSYRETLTLNGQTRHWDTVLVPVRDADGRIGRLIGSGRDVTGQVLAEEALRQAQKMEAVGQLTGGIAHDFNNLLGAVVGSLDLIRRKASDVERVRRFAEAGLQAAERGAKLTGQLLAFSRAQRIELRPVAVADLVDGMRDLLGRTLGPMVRLTFRLDDAQAAVLSDPTQLEMAILNLAINARDAMPDGGALGICTTVRDIRDDAELSPGVYVELAVSDSGAGMAPEVAARAFDPFFTTKGVGKGTGLGLSQVYGIARQTGGVVRIESRQGIGTTVRVYLPRTEIAPPTDHEAEAPSEAGNNTAATILVVDDDPDLRRVLVDALDALGYAVLEAEDGPSGLAALDKHSPDLMMLDFAMPGMNGAEVARIARERRPGLPVLFASGYADTAAIESVAGREAVVLRKPFRIDELQVLVAETLAGPASPRKAASKP